MQSYGIEGNLLTLSKDYLTVHHQRVVLNRETSLWLNVTATDPQGFALGPLSFLIYIMIYPMK